MGNQLLKGYDIKGQPIPGVGGNKMWKMFHGVRQSTNTPVTIFAIEKRNIKSSEREEVLRLAKKQAMGLARIRHPGVLAINETLIEDEQIIAFSTEKVIGNLATLQKQKRLKQIVSNELQLRLNLLSILDTVQFLHENVKTVHLSLNFDNIYITTQGKWKISGFGMSQIYNGEGLQMLSDFKCDDFSFCAPEIAIQQKFERTSDAYSIGLLIVNLLMIIFDKYTHQPIKSKRQYEQHFEKNLLKKVNGDCLQKLQNYKELKILLKNLFNRDTERRGTLSQISNSKWLNDRLVLTVKYLQNITTYDSKQQIEFLKGLLGVFHDFNRKILLKRIFPTLMDYLKFKNLVPSIIYICLEVAKDSKIINGAEFIDNIWPHLKKVTLGKQMTAHSLLMLVDKMTLLQKVVSLHEVKQTIIPLYIKCFDCPAKLKDLALRKTEYIMAKMDYQFIKTKMIPKIMSCMKDSNQEIRKKSLIALKKSIKILDSQTVVSHVLPGLQNSRKAGTDPFINALTVFIYGQLAKSLSTDIISSKLIPTILPYLTDPSVTKQDFYSYKKAMIDMFQKIEYERQKYWEQNDDPNTRVYTEKDFDFVEETEAQKSSTEIGKGNFNFLSNYSQQTKKEQAPRTHEQPQFNFNYGGQLEQPQNSYQMETQKIQQPPKKSIDFQALSFQSPSSDFPKQESKQMSFDFSDPISPQTHYQNPKVLKGPSSNQIKPIKKEPTRQQAYDPFSTVSLSSNQQTNTMNINTTTTNTMNQMNMGGFSNDPFSSLSNPSQNSQSLNFNQPTINEPPKVNQGSFSTSNDPFASLQQTNQMGFGYQQTSQQTNMNMGMGFDMGFETKKEEKKKDFDFDLL